MNRMEKLADDFGQLLFQLETNFETYRTTNHPQTEQEAQQGILKSIESLKLIKHRILGFAGWPEKAQEALDALYAQFGNYQTPEQKYKILERELGGECYYFSVDDIKTKVAILEHEWLENKQLIQVEHC